MGEKQDLLAKLREAKEAKYLSYQDIVEITEQNGEAVSLSTIKRVFAKDADIEDFRYKQTMRPIIRAVLGMDEDTQPPEPEPTPEKVEEYYTTTEALKAVIDFKSEMMEKLEVDSQKKIDYLKGVISDLQDANKWYKRVIGILGTICILAMLAVILDLAIGSIGWIRY